MDENTARQTRPRLNALRTFVHDVATIGHIMPDDSTRHNYREMYAEIEKILNDPSFRVFAPPLPHLGTGSDDSGLWTNHQVRILDSGRRVIASLEAELAELGQGKITKRPLRCFFSYRFNESSQKYIHEVRRFLIRSGVFVMNAKTNTDH